MDRPSHPEQAGLSPGLFRDGSVGGPGRGRAGAAGRDGPKGNQPPGLRPVSVPTAAGCAVTEEETGQGAATGPPPAESAQEVEQREALDLDIGLLGGLQAGELGLQARDCLGIVQVLGLGQGLTQGQ